VRGSNFGRLSSPAKLISLNFNRETAGERLPFVGQKWRMKTRNSEALTERFKRRFPTGESLFNCMIEEITEVDCLTEKTAKEMHAAVQAMKNDPTCFGPKPLWNDEKDDE
jgi:hypothetical protein